MNTLRAGTPVRYVLRPETGRMQEQIGPALRQQPGPRTNQSRRFAMGKATGLCECGCGTPVRRRFVSGHNARLATRVFEECFKPSSSCWVWTATTDKDGYGIFSVDGKPKKAHRLAYRRLVGPIPVDTCVLHKCDNPPCVNPAHLFLGSVADNNRDRANKGRSARNVTFAKLTPAQAAEIRTRYSAGGTRQKDLAHEFGVSQGTVSLIVLGLRWATA